MNHEERCRERLAARSTNAFLHREVERLKEELHSERVQYDRLMECYKRVEAIISSYKTHPYGQSDIAGLDPMTGAAPASIPDEVKGNAKGIAPAPILATPAQPSAVDAPTPSPADSQEKPQQGEKCPTCKGRREVTEERRTSPYTVERFTRPCPSCTGRATKEGV
jgi:hypothetical protein